MAVFCCRVHHGYCQRNYSTSNKKTYYRDINMPYCFSDKIDGSQDQAEKYDHTYTG